MSKTTSNFLIELLDLIEEKLLQMITGILRFVIRRIPQLVLAFFAEWMPVAIKILRLSAYGAMLLLLIIGPLCVSLSCALPSGAFLAVIAWTFVAFTGSVWGVNCVRVRHRTLLDSLRQGFVDDVDAPQDPSQFAS